MPRYGTETAWVTGVHAPGGCETLQFGRGPRDILERGRAQFAAMLGVQHKFLDRLGEVRDRLQVSWFRAFLGLPDELLSPFPVASLERLALWLPFEGASRPERESAFSAHAIIRLSAFLLMPAVNGKHRSLLDGVCWLLCFDQIG